MPAALAAALATFRPPRRALRSPTASSIRLSCARPFRVSEATRAGSWPLIRWRNRKYVNAFQPW